MSYSKTIRFNKNDIKIFEVLGKFGWVREDILQKYLGVSDDSMRWLKYRLLKHGYIEKFKVIQNIKSHIRLSKIGAEFVGVKYVKNIQLSTVAHDDFVVKLALEILGVDISNILVESEIKQEQVSENNIKASLNEISSNELKKRSRQKIPDLIVGDIAYEVEITQKADFRLKNIVNFYIGSGFKEVHYYTKKSIMKRIQELSNFNSKFIFHLLDENTGDLLVGSATNINERNVTVDINEILNKTSDSVRDELQLFIEANRKD